MPTYGSNQQSFTPMKPSSECPVCGGPLTVGVTANHCPGCLPEPGPDSPSGELPRLLDAVEPGNATTAETLLPLVYQELRRLAASKLAREAANQTLQPTALVHEAWLRLVGNEGPVQFANRAHFFAAAAEAMRRILIDRARRRLRLRHGGGQERVELEEIELPVPTSDERLLLVSEALDELATLDPWQAEVVKLMQVPDKPT